MWLSVYSDSLDEKRLMRGLKSCGGWLRHELGQSLDLRYTPELVFELDKSIEYGAHISKVISGLDIPPEAKETTEDDKC